MRLVLDTHILLWWLSGSGRLPPSYLDAIGAADEETPLLLPEIGLWEIATLLGLGHISLSLPSRDWLEKASAPPLVRRVGIPPAIAAEVASLPDTFHRDPAARLIVATARVFGATLMTRDQAILRSGLVPVLDGGG